jgi:antitoxin (DNA-binding transcriptional repressor) of toxin-antitoxin stability system
MRTVNINEAKRQLSRLVDQAVKGEAFVIAKAGKPLVKVEALDAPRRRRNGLGSLRERSKCLTTLTIWRRARSRPCSEPRREAAARH